MKSRVVRIKVDMSKLGVYNAYLTGLKFGNVVKIKFLRSVIRNARAQALAA